MKRETSNSGSTCSRCGTVLPNNELEGGCPKCLATALFASDPPERPASPEARVIRYFGDYELLEEIARGAMGIVYRARQVSLNRQVAVKLMRDSALAGLEEVRRFRVEAAAAARLKHPNIVSIHEVGEQGAEQYFSMDLIEGVNLAQRTREGPLSPREAAELVATIAEAVQHAHAQGVLHRDLKPSNVLIDFNDQPFVTDFGLARPLDADSSLTITGQILGTPGYMPPEQATGEGAVGPAADIYSLGAILYHLLTGRAPFVGGTAAETLRHAIEQEPVSPQLLNPEVPRDAATICLKCLEKEPSRRYRSAGALAQDLRRWLAHEPIHARPATTRERVVKWVKRKPMIAALSAMVVSVALVGLTGIIWQWRAALRARAEAQQSARDAATELRKAQLAQLQLVVGSRRQGHRLDSLRLIRALATNEPSDELRELAITALASSDVRETGNWREFPFEPSCLPALDGRLGRIAAGDDSGRIHLFSFPEMRSSGELFDSRAPVASLEWVNADQWLAAVFSDGQIRIWDVASARLVFATNGCSGGGHGQRLAVHPRGTFVAMSGVGNGMRTFDLQTGEELRTLKYPWPVDSLAFSPDGDKLAISFFDRLEVREFPSLTLMTDDPTSKYFANQIVWEPDARWFYGAMQGWNVLRCHPGLGLEGQVSGYGHDAAATRLSANAGGSLLLSYGADTTTYLWMAHPLRSELSLPRLTALRFASAGNRFVCWKRGRQLGVFEAIPTRELRHFMGQPPHTVEVRSCFPHPSLPLLATTSKFHASVFDLEAGEERVNVELPGLAFAGFNGDGTQLITVSSDGVQSRPLLRNRVWELGNPKLLASLGTNFPVRATILHSSSLLTAAGSDRGVVVNLHEGSVVKELPPPRYSAFPAVTADGSWWIYSQPAPEGTWTNRATTPNSDGPLSKAGGRVSLSPNGALLAVAGTSRLECFNTRDWTLRWSVAVELPTQDPAPCVFSANGEWLAVSLRSHDVTLLDSMNGKVLARLKPPNPPMVFSLSFGPGDTQLFAGTIRGVFVWDLPALRRELASLGLDWEPATSSK